MKKIALLLFTSIFILQSCGEDKKPLKKDVDKNNSTTHQTLSLDNNLKFEINGDFPTSESLVIFWRPKEIGWFEEKNTVYGGTNGFEGDQTIPFVIPDSPIPVDFRFDISSNPEQKEIKINFIKIERGNREFYVFGEELDKYFKFNEYIRYDKSSKKVFLKSIDGNYDPYFTTTDEFLEQFNKIYYNY